MKPALLATIILVLSAIVAKAESSGLVEPKLHIKSDPGATQSVALTFDACTGKVDERILNMLIDNQIPSTVFVTARWLKHNPAVFQMMLSRPDLFEIENHGENHIPAVDIPMTVFGLEAAGSPDAVTKEIVNGAEAITQNGGMAPVWFRGATAKYTTSSIKLARSLGFNVAGYSLNGDVGASVSEAQAEKNVSAAKNGDVILAHINQPTHPAGAGIVKGILALQAKGTQFVKLGDLAVSGTFGTTSNPAKVGF